MSKSRKIIIIILLGLLIGAFFMYNYVYQEHRDIKTETAKLKVEAKELVKIFANQSATEVLNSTVEVTGKITEIGDQSITIDESVQCSFDQAIQQLKLNDPITIKGRCIGYDDLFEIVKLDQSTIVK
ncbi:MAG: OB-fold protein [Flavobacteriales bacterium]